MRALALLAPCVPAALARDGEGLLTLVHHLLALGLRRTSRRRARCDRRECRSGHVTPQLQRPQFPRQQSMPPLPPRPARQSPPPRHQRLYHRLRHRLSRQSRLPPPQSLWPLRKECRGLPRLRISFGVCALRTSRRVAAFSPAAHARGSEHAAKTRKHAIGCVAAVATVHPPCLHALWGTFIPHDTRAIAKASRAGAPSLLTALLYDPSFKVRAELAPRPCVPYVCSAATGPHRGRGCVGSMLRAGAGGAVAGARAEQSAFPPHSNCSRQPHGRGCRGCRRRCCFR